MTKTEIINETAEFYNTSNRGYDAVENYCVYLSGEGMSCAIGRCIKPEKLSKFNEVQGTNGVYYIDDVEEWFDDKYLGHTKYFWAHIQIFHDCSENWNEEGLTGKGRSFLRGLLKQFAE